MQTLREYLSEQDARQQAELARVQARHLKELDALRGPREEIAALRMLTEVLPDLQFDPEGTNCRTLSSRAMNARMTNFSYLNIMVFHESGKSSLRRPTTYRCVRFDTKVGNHTIHSDPSLFKLAKEVSTRDGTTFMILDDWEQMLRKASIPEQMIAQVGIELNAFIRQQKEAA